MKFETYDEVQEYINHEKLECLICGESYKFLGGHIRQAHNIHADEYRIMFNLPIHAPLAGLSYRKAHRETMKENIELGKIKVDKSPERMKEISKKGAIAKAIHSGATQRIYMHKGKQKHINTKLEAAKAAEAMGDPTLIIEYHKFLIKRKEFKEKEFKKLGVKSCNEVAVMLDIVPRDARKYALMMGVKRYEGYYKKYGWTNEEIENLKKRLKK